jgi:hypothetical protein
VASGVACWAGATSVGAAENANANARTPSISFTDDSVQLNLFDRGQQLAATLHLPTPQGNLPQVGF